jgi:hypothetical protein
MGTFLIGEPRCFISHWEGDHTKFRTQEHHSNEAFFNQPPSKEQSARSELTRALLTRQLLLLALELACTMVAWPLLEVSLRIKGMHIKEKRLEPT